jgi:hypothetical protein
MFPDYPDHLITKDPRSPYYDDSNDDLYDMGVEELKDALSEVEAGIEEQPRNHRTERFYQRAETLRQLLRNKR